MKVPEGKPDTILWVEAFGFSLIIALSWLTELARIPHLVFGETFIPNWHRAALRTVVVLLIWTWVHLSTRKLLKRLHHLEEFLRICSWCRKVCHHDEWLDMEEFFKSRFDTKTTHGMCPDCLEKQVGHLAAKSEAPAIPPGTASKAAALPAPAVADTPARSDMFGAPR